MAENRRNYSELSVTFSARLSFGFGACKKHRADRPHIMAIIITIVSALNMSPNMLPIYDTHDFAVQNKCPLAKTLYSSYIIYLSRVNLLQIIIKELKGTKDLCNTHLT